MKFCRHAIHFGHPALAAVASLLVFTLASCDQVSDLVDKAKALLGDDKNSADESNAGVEEVNEQEGKAVLAEESRLVMVEFYSDT